MQLMAHVTAAMGCLFLLAQDGIAGAENAPASVTEQVQHFERNIAPLLARHCLECHCPASKKGRLDLSRKETAFAGGESGKAIVPGQAADSLLWQYIEAGEMPKDRPPLSDHEKRLLKSWIDDGAIWSNKIIEFPQDADTRNLGSNWVRRLTVSEYVETVRHSVGIDIQQDAQRLLPRDLRADGFNNTAYSLGVDLAHVEAYAQLAEIIVRRMDVLAFAKRFSPSRELDDANLRRLISQMGKWLLRGPLEKREIAAYLQVASAVVKEGGDFEETVRYLVEALLQSPRFLYRIEKQPANGKAQPVQGYELASRLSYALWGGPPDQELMQAAEAGKLGNRSQIEAQVRRMLSDRRAVEQSTRFVEQWLNLTRLESLRPNLERFPNWDAPLAADMRAETLAYFEEITWEQQRPLADLMNAQLTFATPQLARHYGLPLDKAENSRYTQRLDRPHISKGLEALYTFRDDGGNIIRDMSGAGESMHLRIADSSAVQWTADGLSVRKPSLITTASPPQRLIEAIQKSNAITLEAWITPENTRQNGPARILTLSSGTVRRNFTLGQEADKFDVRVRTTKTDANGIPSLTSPSGTVQTRPTHIVYTRAPSGRVLLYIDGEQKAARDVGGNLSNWDQGFQLSLANETTKDRPWQGTYHLMAVYSRVLSPEEIRQTTQGLHTGRGRYLQQYDLSAVRGRGGLLTQGSLLTIGGDEASMVTRGLFVLRELLYSGVDDPPPCVDTTPVPTKPGLSQRAVALARLANNACGGCHAKFEPLAFGLEKFDGVGAYHDKDEHGNTLRDDGEVLFPDTTKPVSYQSSAELMDLLAGSERVRMGMTRKIAQFVLGRPLVAADEPALEKIHKTAQAAGGTYADVINAVVLSDLVQMTAPTK